MLRQPISVLHFTRTLARYGAEEHILTLLRHFTRDRFRLHLVCPPELAEQIQGDLPDDVELFAFDLEHLGRLEAARKFGRILREHRIEILHSHMSFSSRFASPVASAVGVPVILETPHVAENWRRGWWKSHFVVDRCFGRFVDYFIAVSEANARYLVAQKGLPSAKVVVIHNGCDLSRFMLSPAVSVSLRKELGIAVNDPVVVVPARLEPQKGHRVLLDSLVEVRIAFPNLRVICLGEGSLRQELELYAAALGLDAMVRFVGFRSDIADWLALSAFSVLPSLYEGLPLVAIESLAASRAVVATAVDGTPEVVVHGETGLTVQPGDAAGLGHAISALLRSPELREKFGRQGRLWVERHFNQELQVRQTEELYLHALDQTHGPLQIREEEPVGEWASHV